MTSSTSPDRFSLAAFFLVVFLGGSNSVAIRFGNRELAPFWGAALRFIFTSLVFWLIVLANRMKLPSRRDLLLMVLNGFFFVGVSFALFYWGLQKVPAGLAATVLSLGPLFTFVLAILHGLERFRFQVLLGGLTAVVGMMIAVNAQPGNAAMLPYLTALLVGALISAEGNVLLKTYSARNSPAVINAVSLSANTMFLLGASFFTREPWIFPSALGGRLALAYLVLGGSVIMLYLFVYLVSRWTASAASYTILCFPLVATALGALLVGEKVTPIFLAGGAIVVFGVWIGAFYAKAG